MNEQTRLARPTHAVPFTADDFLRMVEVGAFADMRAELVRGDIEKMMPAHWAHGELTITLGALIFPHARGVGARIGGDVVLWIDDTTIRAPDLVVVRPGAAPVKVLRRGEVLLAIEVAETTQARDLREKSVDYAAVGIPAYWVFDIAKSVTHCFTLDETGAAYGPALIVPFGKPLELPEIGGSISLD